MHKVISQSSCGTKRQIVVHIPGKKKVSVTRHEVKTFAGWGWDSVEAEAKQPRSHWTAGKNFITDKKG